MWRGWFQALLTATHQHFPLSVRHDDLKQEGLPVRFLDLSHRLDLTNQRHQAQPEQKQQEALTVEEVEAQCGSTESAVQRHFAKRIDGTV